MIEIVCIEPKNVPMIRCDSCGQQILKAAEAAVVFKGLLENGERTAVAYVHKDFVKGGYLSMVERRIRSEGAQPSWLELSQYLAHVIANTGMTAKEIRAPAY